MQCLPFVYTPFSSFYRPVPTARTASARALASRSGWSSDLGGLIATLVCIYFPYKRMRVVANGRRSVLYNYLRSPRV